MKKRNLILPAVVLTTVLLLYSCGALFMGEEEKELIGLWRSPGWSIYTGTFSDSTYSYSSDPDYCYYDFHDDGKVYMTSWTENLPLYEYGGIAVHFNYSRTGDELKFSQYYGTIGMDFSIVSISDTYIELYVEGTTSGISAPDTLILTKIIDFTETDLMARSILEEYANEN